MPSKQTVTNMFLQLEEAKQNRVLNAAIDEFSSKNYNNASMNVVVRSAGISKGALFKYFKSKADLFNYVYRMALECVKDYLRGVRDESESEDFFIRLERVIEAGLNFIETHPRLAAIYYRILYTGDSPFKQEIVKEVHSESLAFIRSLIEKGIERSELRSDINPETAAFLVEAVVDRFVYAHHAQFTNLEENDVYGMTRPNSVKEIIYLLRSGLGSEDEVK